MNAQTINTIGGVCQIAGVVLVVVDLVIIHEHRGDLGRMRAAVIRGLRSVFPQRRRAIKFADGGHASTRLSTTSSGISTQLWPQVRPGASVEERIAALEELPDLIAAQLERERRAQAEARRDLAEQLRGQLRGELQAEVQRLTGAIATVQQRHERLEELTTGSTQLGWTGVLLLLAGVGLTTWPDGMAAWPTWLPECLIALLALAVVYILTYKPNSP
jgi:hypothetical protein